MVCLQVPVVLVVISGSWLVMIVAGGWLGAEG